MLLIFSWNSWNTYEIIIEVYVEVRVSTSSTQEQTIKQEFC